MSCYERFGWGPEQVRQLPESEALLLAVYFEEATKQALEQTNTSSSSSSSGDHVVEFEVGEDE